MAGSACGIGAIEGVDAKGNTPFDRGEIADAEQVVWLFFGEEGKGVGEECVRNN